MNTNNEDYILILLSRLQEALKDNITGKAIYEEISKDCPEVCTKDYFNWLNNLDHLQYKSYTNHGYIHSKAEIKRLRIELNTALMDLYK